MCFDWDAFIASFYRGLAVRVTGERLPRQPGLRPRARAAALRPARRARAPGRGRLVRPRRRRAHRQGRPAARDRAACCPRARVTGLTYAQKLQEDLARVGRRARARVARLADLVERVNERDFDAAHAGLVHAGRERSRAALALALGRPQHRQPRLLRRSRGRPPDRGAAGRARRRAARRALPRAPAPDLRASRSTSTASTCRGASPPRGACATSRPSPSSPGYSLRRWYFAERARQRCSATSCAADPVDDPDAVRDQRPVLRPDPPGAGRSGRSYAPAPPGRGSAATRAR